MISHEESKIQRACVQWFRAAHKDLTKNLIAIPNGMLTSPTQARIAKAEGLTAGASDLVLFCPNANYHALCIEMKTGSGRQQPTQKEWQAAVESFGYKYVIIRNVDDFISEINNYLLGI